VIGDRGYRIKAERGGGGCVGPDELRAELAREPKTRMFDEVEDTKTCVDRFEKAQALRFNSNKPESDYIFTYAGGVDAAFPTDHPYYATLQALGEVYRSNTYGALVENAFELVLIYGQDARDAGQSVVDMIADTNTRGAKKYAPGNYLKGANLRQYFQGCARHAQKPGEKDAEGFSHDANFGFNVLMIQHCIALGIGVDDRIKVAR